MASGRIADLFAGQYNHEFTYIARAGSSFPIPYLKTAAQRAVRSVWNYFRADVEKPFHPGDRAGQKHKYTGEYNVVQMLGVG